MIGIAGGTGPLAGLDLFRKIIEETKASTDQEHLPVLLWSSPQEIPDRTEYLEGTVKENPAIPISNILLHLEKAGATVSAISCNTAHAPEIFDEIVKALKLAESKIRLINIVDETIDYLKKNFSKGTTIGVLSTTGTWKYKIYRRPLEKAGFIVLDSKNMAEQQIIHQAIYNKEYGIKSQSSPVSEKARKILLEAIKSYIFCGADVVILGCTEISLAITEKNINNIELIDPTRLLARSLIRHFSPKKSKEPDKRIDVTQLSP